MIVQIEDASQVAEARRAASHYAQSLRFDDTAAGKAALVATELATNVLKHGGGGSILFTANDALTLVAIDKGRGIQNVDAALRDGYSTAGSPGTGLGAAARAADVFDVYSLPGLGTAVLCKVESGRPRVPGQAGLPVLDVAGVCVPKRGEDVSGDAWTWSSANDVTTVSVIDGLGHGPVAATAAMAAVRVADEHGDLPLDRLMQAMHEAMRATRGAAVGIARIQGSRTDFAGVGNIAGAVIDDDAVWRVVSMPGIVGAEMRKVQTFSYPWTPSSVLLLHSDGISSSWNPKTYPGLLQRDPALIAAVFYRDHCRGTDDATVVVAKVV